MSITQFDKINSKFTKTERLETARSGGGFSDDDLGDFDLFCLTKALQHLEKLPVIKSYSLQDTLVYETVILNKKHFYFKTQQLNKIIRVANGKEKVVFLFSEIKDTIAHQINVRHSNIKLNINLKLIN